MYIYIANLNLHDKREARSLRSLANYCFTVQKTRGVQWKNNMEQETAVLMDWLVETNSQKKIKIFIQIVW